MGRKESNQTKYVQLHPLTISFLEKNLCAVGEFAIVLVISCEPVKEEFLGFKSAACL